MPKVPVRSDSVGTPNSGAQGSLRIRQACLDHAANLIAAAERLMTDNGFPNIAYHLSTLALEEIGKAGMAAARLAIGRARDTQWIQKRLDDHIFKLQWAIWSPSLSSGKIDPKDFEEARRFAEGIHFRRLNGLYVDPAGDDGAISLPSATVTGEQATSLLSLAHARLELEQATGDPSVGEPNEDLTWFLSTLADETGAAHIFSRHFIAKYEELKGDTRAWVNWARQQLATIAAEEQAHLQRELARVPSRNDASKQKWVIKIRVYTPSHSIGPKVLNYWNDRMEWVKLRPSSDKKQVRLEITLPDTVSLKNLYEVGLSFSKLCIAALNIGSLGFFWYELSNQTSRYYDRIIDLDAPNMKVVVDRDPGFLGRWKQRALSEENLQHALQFVAAFAPIANEVGERVFGPYLRGLVLLSKSDIHLSCEAQARDAFIESLRNGCAYFGDWDGSDTTFISSLHAIFEKIAPDSQHREKLFEVLASQDQSPRSALQNAVSAKQLADLYYVLAADRLWSRQMKKYSNR